MERTRYNLRSKKKECSIPVQLKLASDEDFMEALIPSTSGQVSYSEPTKSRDSDIDISDMINHSDQKFSDPVIRVVGFSTYQTQGPVDSDRKANSSVSQNNVNMEISTQLRSLGDRLAAIQISTRPNISVGSI